MKHIVPTSHASSGRVSLVLLVLFGLGLLLLGLVLSPIPPSRNSDAYPSRKAAPALQFFRQHQADFERLRALVNTRPALVYLHLKRRETTPGDVFANDPAAFNEVLDLMTRLQVLSLNGRASNWGMRMSFWREGMVTAGLTQSFWCSDTPPPQDRILAAHEGQLPVTGASGSAFCEITPRWYLRLDWGG